MRFWMHEVFYILHISCNYILLVSLWFHPRTGSVFSVPRVYTTAATILLATAKIYDIMKMLYLNVSASFVSTAKIREGNGIIEIQVELARHMRFKAGQFVYLSIPWLDWPGTALQRHPFQVFWTSENQGSRQTIVMLAQIKGGFTGKMLVESARDAARSHTALVWGPYGKSINSDNYDNVVLFANGIGITAFVLYMNQILKQNSVKGNAQRITLYWEIESEGMISTTSMIDFTLTAEDDKTWVANWVNKIIKKDTQLVRFVHLYSIYANSN